MNTIREIEKINQQELDRGIAGTSASWHAQYEKSAWIYAGNLDHELTEGDVVCVLSQFGEIEDIHLVREEDTGKSRGFAFVKYEDSRSCVLAVDNLGGVKVCDRSLRIDHVEKYRLPKKLLEQEEANEQRDFGAGHAYKDAELSNQYSIRKGQDLFAPHVEGGSSDLDSKDRDQRKQRKEEKKRRREKKDERRRRREEQRDVHEARKRKKRSRKGREDDKARKRRRNDRSSTHRRKSESRSTSPPEQEHRKNA